MAVPGTNEGYKRLEIYRLSHALAIRVHALSLRLPAIERYEEAPQVRRSAKRVPAGIVEGYDQRKYRDEFLRYLYRSLGSSDETLEHLEILLETGSTVEAEAKDLVASYGALSKMIARFIVGVERFHTTPVFITAHPQSTIHKPQSKIK